MSNLLAVRHRYPKQGGCRSSIIGATSPPYEGCMTQISQSVSLDRQGRVAVVTVNNPPVNALSHHVRQGLRDAIAQAAGDSGAAAIVIPCAGRTFIAGPAITEFA